MGPTFFFRLIFIVGILMVFLLACEQPEDNNDTHSDESGDDDSGSDDDDDDDNNDDDNNNDDDDNDIDEGFFDDFESYATGEAPDGRWSVQGLSGTALIEVVDLAAKATHGQVVEFVDPDQSSAGALLTEIPEGPAQGVFRLEWDWNWIGGQGMGLNIYGYGMSRIVQIDLWEGRIEAASADGGYEICVDPVEYDTWIHLDLTVDVPNETFTLTMDQSSTPCAEMAFVDQEETTPEGFLYNMYVDAEASTYLDNVGLVPGTMQVENELAAIIGPTLERNTFAIYSVIRNPELGLAQKHDRLNEIMLKSANDLFGFGQSAKKILSNRQPSDPDRKIQTLLKMIETLATKAQKTGEYPPYWNKFEDSWQWRDVIEEPFEPNIPDSVADRFWLFYHWTEILGALYDDTDYQWVFADSARTGFIAEEAGQAGLDQFHDWWMVDPNTWDDAALSDNQKLMATKYTMWQNPDWGGGGHYIDEWWSWEAGYKEEDCALFTGNNMAALAMIYGVTRDNRTLTRLTAMLDTFKYYDTLTVDDPNPLAQEPPDGRITRGTKTRNLYLEDEMEIFTITFDAGGVNFHHNNSWPDHYTGRERKNVSRDQYYGMILGYYSLWKVLTDIPDRTAGEQQLLDDLVAHTTLVTDYIFGQSNIHWDWGWEYMVYALFEGSCANPPNFTFMMYFGHVGLEEMTGQSFPQFDFLHGLGQTLFEFGRALGLVELSRTLFEPAHTGLTALNQYLSGFFMSDITEADWLFLWPPEILEEGDAGRRRLWRRVVAAFYNKYGVFGTDIYRNVAMEVFDETLNPVPTIQTFYNSLRHGHYIIEPAHVALENFMLPLGMLINSSENSDSLGALMNARYQFLVNQGSIDFSDTDLPY